jgi:hypothetical protein
MVMFCTTKTRGAIRVALCVPYAVGLGQLD